MEMTLTADLHQRMTLTPQLRQSVEILQMSALELSDFLSGKFLDNPMVELTVPGDYPITRRKKSSPDRKVNAMDFIQIESGTSLENFLLEQLAYLQLDERLHGICAFVAGCLDANGYLSVPIPVMAGKLKASEEEVYDAVRILQTLEPYGVAASCLRECLLIQLDCTNAVNELARSLIENDLDSIAQGKIPYLAQKYKKTPQDIQRAIHQITGLDPKPGSQYSKEPTHYIVPDVTLRIERGETRLLFNASMTPQIKINRYYAHLLRTLNHDETVYYLRQQLKEASWISQCLEHRKTTLLSVATVIFQLQQDFCRCGPGFVKPITLQQVAGILEVHESTVSRAVKGKYAATPWGVYELKWFFSSSIRQSDGDTASAVQIKERIQNLIRGECKSSPLSDQKVANLLQTEGFLISRRTVTKYREQLKIGVMNTRIRY